MNTFKDCYNNLDILNLILFWGTIIVIILIIIFLTLYFSRKKNNGIKEENNNFVFDDIDIIKHNDNQSTKIEIKKDEKIEKVDEEINLENNIDIPIQKEIIKETVEDYPEEETNNITIEKVNIIEPSTEKTGININIEKNNTIEVKKDNDEFLFDELIKKDTNNEKPRAYQKNVFREMNLRNQTSPIGIIRERKTNPIDEYKESLTETKDSYLENVYNSLSEATVPDKVELTEYEKRQEEDAVISYQELLKKKDTIDYDREEDAVISYGELVNRNSRLYNIREEEEDKEFLSELKKFRKDL